MGYTVLLYGDFYGDVSAPNECFEYGHPHSNVLFSMTARSAKELL